MRVNNDPTHLEADLDAVVVEGLRAIVLPKVEEAADLEALSSTARDASNTTAGMERLTIKVIAVIESPRALERIREIADGPRLIGISLGSEDFASVARAAAGAAVARACGADDCLCGVGARADGPRHGVRASPTSPISTPLPPRRRRVACDGAYGRDVHPSQPGRRAERVFRRERGRHRRCARHRRGVGGAHRRRRLAQWPDDRPAGGRARAAACSLRAGQ